jgi:hypothetical protein
MTTNPEEHAGSDIDKPNPKNLLEKVADGLKSVLSKADPSGQVMPGETGPEPAQGVQK